MTTKNNNTNNSNTTTTTNSNNNNNNNGGSSSTTTSSNTNNTTTNNNKTSSPRGVWRPGPGGTTGTQACAACKYQRRKCASNCLLAPYFPAHDPKQFINAHKLFGVSNIVKLINSVDPSHRQAAVNSLTAQANARATDPVGGCYRIICDLQRQIDLVKDELELVLRQISYISRAHHQAHDPLPPTASSSNWYPDQNPNVVVAAQDHYYCCAGDGGGGSGRPVQECCSNTLGFKVDVEMEGSMAAVVVNGGGTGKQVFEADESEDIKPLLGMFEDRMQPLIPFEARDLIEFRDKIVTKEEVDLVQQQQGHDLKGAASLFSLTNCKD